MNLRVVSGFVTLVLLIVLGAFVLRKVNTMIVPKLAPSSTPAATVSPSSQPIGGETTLTPASSPVSLQHEVVATSASTYSLWEILVLVGGAAVLLSVLYKLSYRWYILG